MVGAACWWVLFPGKCFFFKRLISMPVRVKACTVLGVVLYWLLSTIGCCFRVSVFFLTPDQYACSGKSLHSIGCCLVLVAVYYWLLFLGKLVFLNA